MKVVLPENYRRVADSFDGISPGDKEALIGHLLAQPDANALNKTVDTIIRNGGPKAELVGRIFQKHVPGDGQGSIRSVDNKKLDVPRTKEAGSGTPLTVAHEEPHTSTANPPVPGHPGPSEQDKEDAEKGIPPAQRGR